MEKESDINLRLWSPLHIVKSVVVLIFPPAFKQKNTVHASL